MASTSTTEAPSTSSASAAEPRRPLGVLDPRSWLRPSAVTTEDGTRAGHTGIVDRILDLGIYVALIALVLYFAIASPYFLTQRNLINVGYAVAVTGILAAGMTIALIAGQLDLTVGANVGLVTVTVALLITNGYSPVIAVLAGLAVGAVIGLCNTVLVVRLGINSIIATLAFSLALRGLALILTNGQVKPLVKPQLQDFITARFLGIPVSVYVLIVVFLVAWVVLSFTRSGWHIYGVGGNASAALRSGIRVRRVYMAVFMSTGILAAIGGVITAGNAGSGGPNYANGTEFDVLTAVLLGGIGLAGGSGKMQRTLAGVLVIGVLNNGLTLLSVDTYYQQLARGAVFVLAVILGAISERRRAR
jgi:ribose transport system permease protein